MRSCVLQRAVGVGENRLRPSCRTAAGRSRSLGIGLARFGGEVIAAERDVLRRRDDRLAARGREDVVRRHHQQARFHLRFDRERHVHGHLVAVEVRVVSGANQRMNADGFAFDEHAARKPGWKDGAASARG